MSYRIVVKSGDRAEAIWQALWKMAVPTAAQADQPYQSFDVLLQKELIPAKWVFERSSSLVYLEAPGGDRTEFKASDLGHPKAFDFLLDTLEATLRTSSQRSPLDKTAFKLVAPINRGNIILADILRQRMQDLEYIDRVATFAQPLQQYDGQRWTVATDLATLIRSSIGAIRLCASVNPSYTLDEALAAAEGELQNRLPSPLAIPDLRRRTLAFLEGSGMLPDTGGCARQFYSAAESLGIDVVVLGAQGHWLQSAEYNHWCKAFIPIEFGHDAEFASRIVAAVKKHCEPVEGILTCFDSYHVAVSQAAAELGLPCEPAAAYDVATDKYKLSASQGRKSFNANSIQDIVEIAQTQDLPWPVIIKPCRGWGSELVFRADSLEQLTALMADRMNTPSHGTSFVIEPYCDGPEVDINFALYDGELLFWEIGDENPKSAESGSDSFHELDCVSPSELPEKEQHVLRDSITNTLLKLGFRNGIYHCEARVDNSTTEWKLTESGAPVLLPRSEKRPKEPSCFLMDCNIRPPGLNSSDVVETTWGVDYWALLITIPLRESARVRALAQPFRRGPQYFADMIFVSAEFDQSKKGVWESGNVTEELKQRRPDLAKNISKALTYKKKGDVVPHSSTGTNTFVGYLNIFSRESRAHVLSVATEVRREISNSIEFS